MLFIYINLLINDELLLVLDVDFHHGVQHVPEYIKSFQLISRQKLCQNDVENDDK